LRARVDPALSLAELLRKRVYQDKAPSISSRAAQYRYGFSLGALSSGQLRNSDLKIGASIRVTCVRLSR